MSYSRFAVVLLLAEVACSSSPSPDSGAMDTSGTSGSTADSGGATGASGDSTNSGGSGASMSGANTSGCSQGCTDNDGAVNSTPDGAASGDDQSASSDSDATGDSNVGTSGSSADATSGTSDAAAGTSDGGSSPDTGNPLSGDAGRVDGNAPVDSGSTSVQDSGVAMDSAVGPNADTGAADTAAADTGPAPDTGTDGRVPPVPPVLSILAANQTGRMGYDLTLNVQGSDVNETAFGAYLQLEDLSGNPVAAFTGGPGAAASTRVVLFDNVSAAGVKNFSRTITLPNFMHAFPSIRKVVGSVVDWTDGTLNGSNSITASVTIQSVSNLNNACDPKVVINRCSPGLACNPSTSKCTMPSAPQFTQFAYVRSPGGQGPRLLFAGTDSADDLSNIHLEFLNGSGQPVGIDLGTGTPEMTFDITSADLGQASKLGQFFYADQTAPGFDTSVPQLRATPSGSTSGTGNPMTALVSNPTTAATGGTCDVRGFASCVSGDTCVSAPGSTTSTCVVTSDELALQAAAAPVLDPDANLFATGYALWTNLWGDPPSGCATAGVRGYPQGIVLLHVGIPRSTLTISSANDETNLSTAIFVLPGTGVSVGDPSLALGCDAGLPATLVLSNVSAGDYTIVVNSMNSTGGNFGLTVQ